MPFCFPSTRSSHHHLSDDLPPHYTEKLNDASATFPLVIPVDFKLDERESANRLNLIRHEMRERKVDCYIVQSEDEHQSEYTSLMDRRREYITGFTGSAGTALICLPSASCTYSNEGEDVEEAGQGRAFCFVDSRYYIQAAQQLSKWWTMVKIVGAGEEGVGSVKEFLEMYMSDGCRIGLDPKLATLSSVQALQSSLITKEPTNPSKLVPITTNLVDLIRTDTPSLPNSKVDLHPLKFTGQTTNSKLSSIRPKLFGDVNKMANTPESPESVAYVLPVLPSIAWLLNIRSHPPGDILNVPVVRSYLAMTVSRCAIFIDKTKVDNGAKDYFEECGVEVKPYGVDEVEKWIKGVEGVREDAKSRFKVFAPNSISWALAEAVGIDDLSIIPCPVDIAKAIKNPVEIEGFRRAYLRDGAAMVRWMAWLEDRIKHRKEDVGEWEAGEKLTAYRSLEKYNRGLAYDNISGSGPNGALPHYSPEKGKDRIIDRQTTYVIDAGGQYLDGTIDTTRTLHFGKPTPDQKRAFTRVLQGHIAIETTPFPKGVKGDRLDILARQYLFADGLNFGHGVGHGVGSYLSVHEGPQGIGAPVTLEKGHMLSNEPGFYLEGQWGVRIESVLVCQEVETRYDFGGQWLGFERMTRVPIQSSLVDFSLMSSEQTEWLKAHNKLVFKDVLPALTRSSDEMARKWLKQACK